MFSGRGLTATVRTVESRNDFGEAVYSEEAVAVDNVLVAPGAAADLSADRPEGVAVALTLHWPKEAAGMRLRGALVELADEYEGVYRVIGDPMPYQPELCPGLWCMPVEVERHDG